MTSHRVAEFVGACIANPELARRLAAADPALRLAEFQGFPILYWLVAHNALHGAIEAKHIDLAVLLLEHGASAEYVGPCHETVFGAMQAWGTDERALLTNWLAAAGVTREGLFAKVRLHEAYESPEQAYGW